MWLEEFLQNATVCIRSPVRCDPRVSQLACSMPSSCTKFPRQAKRGNVVRGHGHRQLSFTPHPSSPLVGLLAWCLGALVPPHEGNAQDYTGPRPARSLSGPKIISGGSLGECRPARKCFTLGQVGVSRGMRHLRRDPERPSGPLPCPLPES